MAKETKKVEATNNDCFVIMPIADPDGYDKGHFKKVYEDIFKVACDKAGYIPVRADEVKQTNLIHLDILQKLIESPMAICDLSNRNPNVLFELGLRQAFDKPTVLVQEVGTPKIFDISPLRYTEYRKELKYREVLEDQGFIAESLSATKSATENGEGVNSIVSLLSLSSPASLKDVGDNDAAKMLQIVMSEMNDLRTDFRHTLRKMDEKDMIHQDRLMRSEYEYDRLRKNLSVLKSLIENGTSIDDVKVQFDKLQEQFQRTYIVANTGRQKELFRKVMYEAENIFTNYISKDKHS
ncbi:MAG: hypothetical protein IPG86_15610 [Chitinophagaceae bacterium]|nr:hypothetical protein [Chitinophagaceae bacterium]